MIRKEKIRIYAGWLAVVLLFASSRNAQFSWRGIILVLIGLSIRVWACGHLQKNKDVISSGPYQYTRNPLYVGSFFIGVGFFLALNQILMLLILAPIFVYIYSPVILDEERILEEKFGDEFRKYKNHVPRVIPDFTRKKFSEKETKFSWEMVIKNKEYNAWLGFLLALGLIFLIKSF